MEEYSAKDIEWKSEYDIHNNHIDTEHQKLFSIARKANDIHALATKEEKKTHLHTVLREVYSYTRFHLNSEEEYMKTHNYPHLSNHQVLHKRLLDKLTFIIANLAVFSNERAESELYHFIQVIFLEHIQTQDIKIGQFIQSQ